MTPGKSTSSSAGTTHFGFETVAEAEKQQRVAQVFHSVAQRYDVMNDLMSGGLHRAWKAFTVARAAVRPGMKVLDIAGGTGDLARAFARRAGRTGEVWLTDINDSMLRVGRDRLLDRGVITPVAVCDAEHLPFPDGYFDRVSVAFGLRNMTHKDGALAEMTRVLRPGGRIVLLEHVLAPNRLIAWLQRRLSPFQQRRMGCHLDRRTDHLVRDLGFTVAHHRRRWPGIFLLMVLEPPSDAVPLG